MPKNAWITYTFYEIVCGFPFWHTLLDKHKLFMIITFYVWLYKSLYLFYEALKVEGPDVYDTLKCQMRENTIILSNPNPMLFFSVPVSILTYSTIDINYISLYTFVFVSFQLFLVIYMKCISMCFYSTELYLAFGLACGAISYLNSFSSLPCALG